MLHLHRFHHEQLLLPVYEIAFQNIDGNDGPLHWRRDRDHSHRDRDVAAWTCDGRSVLDDYRGFARLTMMEHSERIAGIDPGTREPRSGAAFEEKAAMNRFRRAPQLCDVIVDEPCVQTVRRKIRMTEQALQE